METLFSEFYESAFDDRIRSIEYQLTSAIAMYTEYVHEGCYTEKTHMNLIDSIKKFFAGIMETINTYSRDLQAKIEDTIRKKEIYRRLKQLRTDLKSKQAKGASMITVMDVWTYQKTYLRMNRELWRTAHKFSKVKYHKAYEIDEDLKKFEDMVNAYAEEIKQIQETTVRVNVSKMLDFVEDELSGKSNVIATLNDAMSEFRAMERDAINLQNRRNIMGDAIVPKHVSFIKRMARAITDFIHKRVVKFITTVVFIFA